ncbi:MAG TPA: methyltransferase domain-containing protein [Actinomycetes bacterium]|jgi:2-polyprenyl-3-methyl-5-hydroxy-6-metoxy-1,4-benzoquinol methylase|nr:methyltransferase domain-containing protein [Actinomycetes bacterium]
MGQGEQPVLEALRHWRAELEAWAIPEEILARAPEPPWGFPVGMFRAKAEQARAGRPTPSTREALRLLPLGGTVLDIGSGAGAASLPLAGRAGRLVAVDQLEEMLEAFRAAAARARVAAGTVQGRWPDVAAEVAPADVVVCNDVLYNVAGLAPFALALTSHARARVVVQITARHPLASLAPLWRHFHGLERPRGPSADDAVAALRALGLEVDREDWSARQGGSFERFEDFVAFTRRRLCLPEERDLEIAEALQPLSVRDENGYRMAPLERQLVTLSWPGTAAARS